MTVREATQADVAAAHAIATASRTAPQWTRSQFDDLLHEPEDSPLQRIFLVAALPAGVVVGFAVASALVSVYPVEAELESIAVAPDMRRRGVGQALLSRVERWARTKQARELRLEVRVSNANAISLYERYGFQASGTRPGYYASPIEDALCMTRTIDGVESSR